MKLEQVTYEQAHALYKLGFPCETVGITGIENFECSYIAPPPGTRVWANNTGIKHPDQDLVAKWLRDEKHIGISVEILGEHSENGEQVFDYGCFMTNIGGYVDNPGEDYSVFESYEKALSAGIDKAIEILLDENEPENNPQEKQDSMYNPTDLFENAVFGDRFLRRDGKLAIFLQDRGTCVFVGIEDKDSAIFKYAVLHNGNSLAHPTSEVNNDDDIIERV